jgi:hypothetical protein
MLQPNDESDLYGLGSITKINIKENIYIYLIEFFFFKKKNI